MDNVLTPVAVAMNGLVRVGNGALVQMNVKIRMLQDNLAALVKDGLRSAFEKLIHLFVSNFTASLVATCAAADPRSLLAGELASSRNV